MRITDSVWRDILNKMRNGNYRFAEELDLQTGTQDTSAQWFCVVHFVILVQWTDDDLRLKVVHSKFFADNESTAARRMECGSSEDARTADEAARVRAQGR